VINGKLIGVILTQIFIDTKYIQIIASYKKRMAREDRNILTRQLKPLISDLQP
jgi:hypothetical protein